MTLKILICDRIADKGLKLLEEKGYKIKKAWEMPKTKLPHNGAQTEEAQLRESIQIAEKIIKALEETVS